MKCKVINTNRGTLEVEINNWLETGKYEIVETNQTQNDMGYITLTIFYLEKQEVREKKLKKLDSMSKNQ